MSVLIAFAAMLLPAQAEAGNVRNVQVSGDKLILQFDGSVNGASIFHLDAPRRIALDIDGAQPGSGGLAWWWYPAPS